MLLDLCFRCIHKYHVQSSFSSMPDVWKHAGVNLHSEFGYGLHNFLIDQKTDICINGLARLLCARKRGRYANLDKLQHLQKAENARRNDKEFIEFWANTHLNGAQNQLQKSGERFELLVGCPIRIQIVFDCLKMKSMAPLPFQYILMNLMCGPYLKVNNPHRELKSEIL